jgi:hypothetical protein
MSTYIAGKQHTKIGQSWKKATHARCRHPKGSQPTAPFKTHPNGRTHADQPLKSPDLNSESPTTTKVIRYASSIR